MAGGGLARVLFVFLFCCFFVRVLLEVVLAWNVLVMSPYSEDTRSALMSFFILKLIGPGGSFTLKSPLIGHHVIFILKLIGPPFAARHPLSRPVS